MLEESNRHDSLHFSSPQKHYNSDTLGEELQESPGTKILKYVQSEYFGQKGEPTKISESI